MNYFIKDGIVPKIGSDNYYHYIYIIINRTNGMYYKGIHSTKDLNDDYCGSGVYLNEDYKKYGKEDFYKVII